jgi:hypothetical protein
VTASRCVLVNAIPAFSLCSLLMPTLHDQVELGRDTPCGLVGKLSIVPVFIEDHLGFLHGNSMFLCQRDGVVGFLGRGCALGVSHIDLQYFSGVQRYDGPGSDGCYSTGYGDFGR